MLVWYLGRNGLKERQCYVEMIRGYVTLHTCLVYETLQIILDTYSKRLSITLPAIGLLDVYKVGQLCNSRAIHACNYAFISTHRPGMEDFFNLSRL